MKSEKIKDVPVASVDKMLQGRVAGVQTGSSSGQPGGMASVRVRGVSSINGVVSPIYVVDGVRVASGDLTTGNTTGNILANMNPDDVENITVLKDAVSTAVYGADAGAGVIVITTYNQIYTMVAKTNIVINTDISKLTGTAQDLAKAEYYQGQAYALRAQGFFDLLRLYGQKYTGSAKQLGIVTPLKYDPKANQARKTVAETEAQIEADFNKALTVMTSQSSYDVPSNKTELSINALKVLMSRYYLYKGDYAKVRSLINDVYGKYSVAARDLYQPSFDYTLRGAAPNAIFELEVGTDSSLSTSSYNQVLSVNGYYNLVALASSYNLYATNDIRKSLISYLSAANGTKYYFLSAGSKGKYLNRTGADNIKMVRYEEALLNGAEAELQPGGDPAKALEYYNSIIKNRGLSEVSSVDLDMIKVERRKELLGEGFRQWDLLRWGNTSFKPADVSANLLAFPIPRQETDIAGTPVVANPGYDN